MPLPEDDRELYELVVDLQERSVTTQRLEPFGDTDASILTELNPATDELKRRGLPGMFHHDGVYEVTWAEPGGNSVTFHTDRFGTIDEALSRAKALQRHSRASLATPDQRPAANPV